jgi:hypothetical protein
MQRPFAKPFPLLSDFRGLAFAGGVDFHGALADFDLPAVSPSTSFMKLTTKCDMDPLLQHDKKLCLKDNALGADACSSRAVGIQRALSPSDGADGPTSHAFARQMELQGAAKRLKTGR